MATTGGIITTGATITTGIIAIGTIATGEFQECWIMIRSGPIGS
jgi:hypothetical protein